MPDRVCPVCGYGALVDSPRSSSGGGSYEICPRPEVGGDAVIRKGLRGERLLWIAAGCTMLAAYGLVVNMVKWDFSKLLGVYVAVFAVVSVLFGRLVFQETVPSATWVGLGLIVAGGLIIQWGHG